MCLLRRQCINSGYFFLVTVGQSLLHYFHVLRAASSNRPLVLRPLHQHKSLVTHGLQAVRTFVLPPPCAQPLSQLQVTSWIHGVTSQASLVQYEWAAKRIHNEAFMNGQQSEFLMKPWLLIVGLPMALAMVVALPDVFSSRLNQCPIQHHPQCVTRIICLAHSDPKHQHDFISCAAVLDQTVADSCFGRCSVAGHMMGNDSISWRGMRNSRSRISISSNAGRVGGVNFIEFFVE
jgi:hypothetical protein